MDAYSELLKILSAEQIDTEVSAKIQSFHGFLTREIALRLIAKEKGLLKEEERVCKISEIQKEGKRISVVAIVDKILPEVVYPSGKRSRSIILKDETGEIALKLWEDGISLCSKIRTGSKISVRNAYEKFGDLNLGYRGSVEILSSSQFTNLGSLPDSGFVHVYATVSNIVGDDGKHFTFSISDSNKQVIVRIVEGKDRGSKMQEGDLVIIDNCKSEGGMLILDSSSRLLLKRQKDMVSGKIENIGNEGAFIWVEIGGKRLVFDRENALKFLNVSIPDDISLETLVGLKKTALINSSANIRVREDNGRFIILR